MANVRTLKMNDDVLVVSISPNGKYIAVALLDCTVKVSSQEFGISSILVMPNLLIIRK